MSDQTYRQDIELGDLSPARTVTDPLSAVKQIHTRVLNIRKLVIATGVELADAAAATVTAETRGKHIPYVGVVTKITLTAHAAITVDAANAFTMTVSKRDAAGANLTTLGTITSLVAGGASFVAFVPRTFTLTNANLQVVQDGFLTWSIAKNGTGVIVPTFDLDVYILDQ